MWFRFLSLATKLRIACSSHSILSVAMQRNYPAHGRGRGRGSNPNDFKSDTESFRRHSDTPSFSDDTRSFNFRYEQQSSSKTTHPSSRGNFASAYAYASRASFHTQTPNPRSYGRGQEPPGPAYYLRDLKPPSRSPQHKKHKNWRDRNHQSFEDASGASGAEAEKLLNKIRRWEGTDATLPSKNESERPFYTDFTIISYNVLAQTLLEQHQSLYKGIPARFLEWNYRKLRFQKEFDSFSPDIMCLQEVQANHFGSFFKPFLASRGYKGVYKCRTGDKPDGCAIFYRERMFKLVQERSVEYRQPGIQVLNRDNVGLIVLLTPRHSDAGADHRLCVATTHLLYNPRRHDVKLAQLQLLFAELDHIAYKDDESPHPYIPVVLTGDFNLEPQSTVYEFVTRGALEYRGLTDKTLRRSSGGSKMSSELIPPRLKISDQCQHASVHLERNSNGEKENGVVEPSHTFATGCLSHKLQLNSVYPNEYTQEGPLNVTTHQNRWATVDYIFYSESGLLDHKGSSPPSLSLLGTLRLPTHQDCDQLGLTPNEASPSDHYPLLASFRWRWK